VSAQQDRKNPCRRFELQKFSTAPLSGSERPADRPLGSITTGLHRGSARLKAGNRRAREATTGIDERVDRPASHGEIRGETQNFPKTAFGHLVMQSADKKLVDRLSQDKRNAMIAIGREALRRFGYAYQQVFDTHLQLFEFLAHEGATATMIGQMLSEVGIVREDGTALPPGTVSSAMSRARERRAAQQSNEPRPAPARPGADMQVAADGGNPMHGAADRGSTTGAMAARRARLAGVPSGSPAQLSRIRPSPKPSAQLPDGHPPRRGTAGAVEERPR
jgi:hypothetical protein